MRGAAETKKAACVLQVKHRLVLLGSESVVLNQKDKGAQKIHQARAAVQAGMEADMWMMHCNLLT